MSSQVMQALSLGTQLNGKKSYSIEKVIGQGGFGITYLATGRIMDGNIPRYVQYTIKEFFIRNMCSRDEQGNVVYHEANSKEIDERRRDFRKEADHLQEVQHKNVVPVNEVFEANNTVYYVMQYLGNQSLTNYVKANGGKLEEPHAVRIISQVADAMIMMHEKHRLTHLDIKPDNIMMVKGLDEEIPVLIDFGLSRHYNRRGNETHTNNVLGVSHGFSPIEQYAGIDYFSPQTDVYAMGATLFYMLTGKTPVKAMEITEEMIRAELPAKLSPNTLSCILKAMSKMPENRMQQASDFMEYLKIRNEISVQPTFEETADDNATVILGTKKTHAASSKKDQNAPLMKMGKICGIGVAAVALVLVGVFLAKSPSAPVETPEPLQNQNTAVVEQEVSAPEKTETEPVVSASPAEPEPTPVIEQKEPAPAPQQTVKQESVSADAGTKISRGSLNLANGVVWTGPVKDGKPDGKGTIKFTQSTQFRGEQVNPGDRVKNAVYKNGEFDSGILVQNDEEIIL